MICLLFLQNSILSLVLEDQSPSVRLSVPCMWNLFRNEFFKGNRKNALAFSFLVCFPGKCCNLQWVKKQILNLFLKEVIIQEKVSVFQIEATQNWDHMLRSTENGRNQISLGKEPGALWETFMEEADRPSGKALCFWKAWCRCTRCGAGMHLCPEGWSYRSPFLGHLQLAAAG